MNFQEAIDYLYSQLPVFQRVGAAAYKKDLGNTIALCKVLGNPQNRFRSVHIAGTNGKGSTSHLLASFLQEAGYKTGLYTSPHLKDFRERIRIDGEKVPESYVAEFVTRHRPELDKISPSFFEYTAGMAFDFFHREEVDIAILETGMGGRLDSTNLVTPLLSVITNIGYDHMDFLGNTLDKIAVEKSGIIKPGVPVVIGETQQEIKHVFDEKAKESHSRIVYADDHYTAVNETGTGNRSKGMVLSVYKNKNPFLEDLLCPLAGQYQLKNVVTALQAIEMLALSGFTIKRQHLEAGIENVMKNTGILGRWQALSQSPRVICDIAHNEDGIGMVAGQLRSLDYRNLHFILGTVNDKNIEKVLALLPADATYYFCKADIPRGLDQAVLKKKAEVAGLKGEAYESVQQAFNAAKDKAGKEDLVFIGGSTFVVAEVL